MIGLMIPSVFATFHTEEVPSWVKNTVGWWADGKIGDEEFLNSIQYLIESKIIVLSSDFQNNTNDSKVVNIELPGKYDLPLIQQFSGKSSDILLGQSQIIITSPDQTTEKFFAPIKNGNFGLFYKITSEHQTGTYYIKAYSGEEKIWQSKFSIHEKSSELIPSWIKNNGKWWNEGKILDSAFLDGIKYLIETQVIEIENKETTKQGSKEKCGTRILSDGTEIPSYLWADGKCYNVPESELFSFDHESELFSFDHESEMSSVCPSEYPHLWSDGNCWNLPEDYEIELECSSDYPYLWSNGYCYNVPECTNNYPHRHSDGQCYNLPEDYVFECPASHPYEWSNGMCYNLPEDYVFECPASHPYEWSNGQCYNLPEDYVFECPASHPYEWRNGDCYNLPECDSVEPYRHSNGMCYGYPEREPRFVCADWESGPWHTSTDLLFCCPGGYLGYVDGTCRK